MLDMLNHKGFATSWRMTDDCHPCYLYQNNFGSLDSLTEITVYGPELNIILSRFANLPVPIQATKVRWFGDLAKFIVANF